MSSATNTKPPHRVVVEPLRQRLTITVNILGQNRTVVDTTSAVQVAETNYPVRYYYPKEAFQHPFKLVDSNKDETYCPYKGFACYYNIILDGDVVDALKEAVWSYHDPFPGSDAEPIRGLVCIAAPAQQFQVSIDGRSVSIEDAKATCQDILAAHPSDRSSPYHPREKEEERRSRSRSRPQHLQPPPMQRSTSNNSAKLQSFPVTRPVGADLELDSTNPMLADIVYRLDDEVQDRSNQHDHDHGHGPQGRSEPSTDEAVLDDHLAWFKDEPWYKKPSEKWLRPFAFLISMAGGMCMGPKLELLNMLVCETILDDPYVGGGIIPGVPTINESMQSTSLITSKPPANLAPFQPWSLEHSSYYPPSSHQESDPVTEYLSNLEMPNSTVMPISRRPSKACYASPEVQSALASLMLRMTLSMGLLAALTTGFWANLSSRKGRLPVLRFAMMGIICTDVVLIAVALVPRNALPFGYNFLVLGTTLEGLLGGYSTLVAIHQSYISDVTPSGTRAHIFAHFMGIVYGGLGLGPTLGGLMVKQTNYILAPFWFAFGTHVLYVIAIFAFIPESTSQKFRLKAAKEYRETREEMKRKAEERKTAELQPLLGRRSREWEGDQRPFNKRVWKRVKITFMNSFLYAPLEPLSFLLPKKVPQDSESEPELGSSVSGALSPRPSSLAAPEASASHISVSRVAPKMRYDLNLFFLSLSYFVETGIIGVMSFKLQYAQKQFLWGSAELGMYLTFLSVTRVLALTFILPMAVKLLHRPVKALRLPHDGSQMEREVVADTRRQSMLDDEGRPLRNSTSYGALDRGRSPLASPETASFEEDATEENEDSEWDDTKKSVEELWTLRAKHLRLIHDSKFDLKLAKISMLVNALAYGLLIFSSTPSLFFLATAITALGGGGGAALSSLALALLKSPADAGKLFGAWSITSAISGTVLGPILFAEIFERTTKTFPAAIFVVATAMFVASLLLLFLVKVRKPISLPSLPARPHPVTSSPLSTHQENGTSSSADTYAGKDTPSAFRSGTWKSAFSLKTANKKHDKGETTKRPTLPSFE